MRTVARRPGDRAIHSHRDAAASEPSALSILTPREQQVLALIGAGGSNAEIAQTLYLGITTVKTHVAAITENWASATESRPP
jgi:DNA-binding NarL/FixJ family response regulator